MWPFHKRPQEFEADKAAPAVLPPHFVLIGFGTHDRLQLSLEARRTLTAYGKAYAVGLPPSLRALLKSLRVQVVDLDASFAPGRPYADAYVEVVSNLLQRAATERPVVLLTPGNPLFMNAVSRTLVMEVRRLGLSLQVIPGISPVDVLVNEAGLNVSIYGLQVFDAPWLAARRLPVSPAVPLIVLNLGGVGLDRVPGPEPDGKQSNGRLQPLIEHLLQFYPPATAALCLRLSPKAYGLGILRRPLSQLAETEEPLGDSSLFIDAVGVG